MDLSLQAKLLRVLQEREVDRVGGREPIPIDVRVVATTNRNLEQAVQEGKFRADLYYRLNVIPITLPPLRERKGDIKLLVDFFIKQYVGANAPKVDDTVLSALMAYSWPGNVRELQNAVQRAAILSRGRAPKTGDFLLNTTGRPSIEEIAPQEQYTPLAAKIEKEVTTDNAEEKIVIGSGMTVQEVEKALIFETLKATNDNRTQAAKLLGISIRTLRNKLNEYGR
jgi:transcriptional regulator with PAS, ATPase and Fis domain